MIKTSTTTTKNSFFQTHKQLIDWVIDTVPKTTQICDKKTLRHTQTDGYRIKIQTSNPLSRLFFVDNT